MPKKFESIADTLGIDLASPLRAIPNDPPEVPEPKTAQEFAERLVNSPEYRASVERRINRDDLAPAVETWYLNTAYGKPTDRVEVKDTTDTLDGASDEFMEQRLAIIRETIEKHHAEKAMKAAAEDDEKKGLVVH